GNGRVTPMTVGAEFWRTIGKNPNAGGTLVTVAAGDGDWKHWEMHPCGDEVLIVLEGEVRMIFERADREDGFDLSAGATLIVPAGTWHRAVGQKQLRMLFMTYG